MPRRYQRARSYRDNSSRRGKLPWKVFQLNKQFKRRLRLLGLAFLVLICTGVVFASLSLYHYLKRPLVAAAKSDLAASAGVVFDKGWDGRTRLDLLLLKIDAQERIERLSVLTVGPADASLTLLEISLDLLPAAPVPGKNSPLLSLTQRSVSRLLGISLDGYLLINPLGEQKLTKSIGGPPNFQNLRNLATPLSWPKIPSFLAALKEDVRTNLSFFDLFNLARLGMAVRFDKVKEATLTTGFFSNYGSGEQFLKETFAEAGIVEEGARILILNGTEQPGLAAQAARLLTHLGGYVLDTANASRDDYAESLLIGGERALYTRRRLAEIFSVAKSYNVSTFAQDPLFSYMQRADLVLILGLDNKDRL